MTIDEKGARRRDCILKAVGDALADVDYEQMTVEDIAARAGVGKSTIYRWWKHKSELVLDTFQRHTKTIFDLDLEQSLEQNLIVQLQRLAQALNHPIGRAMLVVMANHREKAGKYFNHYLLPRREQMHELIQLAIQRGEIIEDHPFDLMLDSLYGPIHYQIIFFNKMPDESYINQLVHLNLNPIRRD